MAALDGGRESIVVELLRYLRANVFKTFIVSGSGARFMGLVHHTDAKREWAYDRKSPIGKLDKALDEAKTKGWTVASMKDDWKRIFAFEK